MDITPTKDFILLEIGDDPGSRIVRPDNRDVFKIDATSLIVIKVGPKCKQVRPGDRIVADTQAIAPFKYEGKVYFLTREDNVGCIIK